MHNIWKDCNSYFIIDRRSLNNIFDGRVLRQRNIPVHLQGCSFCPFESFTGCLIFHFCRSSLRLSSQNNFPKQPAVNSFFESPIWFWEIERSARDLLSYLKWSTSFADFKGGYIFDQDIAIQLYPFTPQAKLQLSLSLRPSASTLLLLMVQSRPFAWGLEFS